MANFLQNKSCLFFGATECLYTIECINELKRFGVNTTTVLSEKRGQQLPSVAKNWTADFFPFDMEFLGRTTNRIINEVRGINRVVYDTTSKPPGTIEWE